MVTNLLLDHGQLGVAAEVEGLDLALALVEEVEDVVEACNGSQEAAVGHEVLAGEAWQQGQIFWRIGEDGRESRCNLGEASLIPKRLLAIERRCNENLKGRSEPS